MNCREVAEFLMAYLAGEIDAAQRAAFEAHLAECEDCVNYLETYEQTVALGKAAFADPDRPAEETVPEELVAAILSARRAKR